MYIARCFTETAAFNRANDLGGMRRSSSSRSLKGMLSPTQPGPGNSAACKSLKLLHSLSFLFSSLTISLTYFHLISSSLPLLGFDFFHKLSPDLPLTLSPPLLSFSHLSSISFFFSVFLSMYISSLSFSLHLLPNPNLIHPLSFSFFASYLLW